MRAAVSASTPVRTGLVTSLWTAYRLVPVSLWRHHQLILQLARREVVSRYRGSLLGLLWSLVTPLLTLALYTFLFGVVFRTRWNVAAPEGRMEFALILFVGLIVHGFLAECLARAPLLILQYSNLVKRVVFPIEILAWSLGGSALFNAAVSFLIWGLAATLAGQPPGWTALWLPLVLAPLVLLAVGVAWLLAAVGVYLRDITHVIGLVTMVLLFLSPIFYRLDAVPPEFRTLIQLNPLTFIVDQVRGVLVWHRSPDLPRLAIAIAVGFGAAGLGLMGFQRMRPGFADVL
jgi:lipopolysaccharide transport system permease protein